jgi:hypothetical protein
MSELPVREMVLYKHGVGFFVREGAVQGDEITLNFRRDDINDVLKSMAVFDRNGGQVLGVHYQTPMDKFARLANSSIKLSDQTSLRDLLRDLRGRDATISFESTPGSIETARGRVIGLDEPMIANLPRKPRGTATVSLLDEDGAVRVFRLDALQSVTPHDEQSRHDLTYFLDTSMREDERRAVTVRLSEGEHDLSVQYVAPSPTWRVSYRVVAESDENGESGIALVQGWGLFDNRLDEDLEDVTVTLVAGQPISFIYELYASRIPNRPTVEDESRIAPGPVEYQGDFYMSEDASPDLVDAAAPRERQAMASEPTGRRGSGLLKRIEGGEREVRAARQMYMRAAPTPQEASAAVKMDAEGIEAGEFFQYAVKTPVNVKRGESALVPILGSEVKYQRELLYNGDKLPKHPVAALRFINNTGLTLERGPVTVVEDSDYKGEAVIPFTKDGNEVYLPYAVELGVKVTEVSNTHRQTTGVHIKDRILVYEEFSVDVTTYKIENTTAEVKVLTIEAPIRTGGNLHDTAPPDVETATHRRWRVNVGARAKTEFITTERFRSHRRDEILRLDHNKLATLLENHWLDEAIITVLSDMLDELAAIEQMKTEQQGLGIEKAELYSKQEQLRENLGALQSTGDEASLRNRMLGQLEESQDRLESIEARDRELTAAVQQAESRVEAIIAGLG